MNHLRSSLDIVLSPHRTQIFQFGAVKARWKFDLKIDTSINPIQTGLFRPSLEWGGGGGEVKRPPLRFLKTIKDIGMKLTPLIKRRGNFPFR